MEVDFHEAPLVGDESLFLESQRACGVALGVEDFVQPRDHGFDE